MNLADLSDWQLLEEYAQRDSDAAFTLLVQRYVNLVYSAAVRQLPSSGLAEDVVQNVFILLARKAHRLSPKTILAGWLLQTTRHVAYTMRRSEARRSRREWQAHSLTATSNETAVWEEIAPLLDDALAQLRESDRAAVSLRYFQHKNLVEVGEALGVTEEAAKKRVARAVERLRTFFTQRGVLLPATVLCGLIVSRAVEIAPAGCAQRVAKAVLRGKSKGG
jgi:RNA polymerase sigma factor (sigma-70 family)